MQTSMGVKPSCGNVAVTHASSKEWKYSLPLLMMFCGWKSHTKFHVELRRTKHETSNSGLIWWEEQTWVNEAQITTVLSPSQILFKTNIGNEVNKLHTMYFDTRR